ncbi:hypothetical protein F5B21DRAFT_516404 [Xylaria acuta]|nr:hypothetical protein F5B21DRAFT_516404 [Xylaria acuta]
MYTYLVFITGCRPLWLGRLIQHTSYSTTLCCVVMIFVLGFDSTSSSRLGRWELITSDIGNLAFFLSYLLIAALSADLGPRADADGTSQTATVHEDQPPPSYSEDPEKGEMMKIGALEYLVNQMPSKEVEVMESFPSPMTAQEGVANLPPVRARTRTQSQAETRALYLIFNMPGSILIFTGRVGQLAHNLPADWVHIGQIRSTIITFSILLVVTVLDTLVRLLRLMREPAPSDKELILRKGNNYSDCVLQCGIVLSFFIVSFDKWLLAALAGDITGAKHILSDGGLPLVYMLITKLPALAL